MALPTDFNPHDEHNSLLQSHVHPQDYSNPQSQDYDVVVIGAGVSGLISVIIGAWLGKKCALIEKHAMGGDCLNTGCVPSKALISSAKAFHDIKNVHKFGIQLPQGNPTVDFGFVMCRMREIRARISHHDSVQRYAREFCDVFIGEAKFVGDSTVEVVGDDSSVRSLRFKKAMIATGASAYMPPELMPTLFTSSYEGPGSNIPVLTSQSFFNLTELPPRLLVVGCGPIGLELAQSMARLGSKVVCFERGAVLLPREDPDAAQVLQKQLLDDGVELVFNCQIVKLEVMSDGGVYSAPWRSYALTVMVDGDLRLYHGDSILNATGRVPNVVGLGLEKESVEWDNRQGILVDEYFQTSNSNIYSCGDCTGSPFKFTHSADFQARMAVRNMFLGNTHKSSDLLIPWCTYTDPEIAHVGKYESELVATGVEHESFVKQLKDVDRCMCDGVSDGFVKITIDSTSCKIIGATVCGPHAGDMISELTVCIQNGLRAQDLSGTIHPYPTTQEATRLACLGFNKYFKNVDGIPMKTLRRIMSDDVAK